MNQLCRVCGEPAAGFHFGAFTCEGCKSFFGRTYNNIGSISECKNNGECIINKKNRTSCKSCRLQKCIKVGMSKSGSRYGRRSNWFKIHCLLQEQSQGSKPWEEDNNNIVKEAKGGTMWPPRLPLPHHLPLFGFGTPLAPLFLARPPLPMPPPPVSSEDVLRSLGPVQEAPIDLSSRPSGSRERSHPPESSPGTEDKKKTPLDLTCVKI